MSVHEYIETALWSDPVFLSLRPNAKLLYVWSFTNPRCNLLGIYKVGREQMRVETGLAVKALQPAIDDLETARLFYYDDTYVFVRARVKHLQGKSPNTAKGVLREIKKLDQRHIYVQAFIFLYRDFDWPHLSMVLGEFDCPAQNPLSGVAA